MSRLAKAAIALVGILVVAQGAFAQMEKIGDIDIKAIKKMQFVEQGTNLMAKNVIVFSNCGDSEVKLRNCDYKVSLKTDGGTIKMGKGTFEELVLPAGTADAPSETTEEALLTVGPMNTETIQRLIALFNVIGDPAKKFTMVLEGTSEVGLKGKRGWIYQKGITVELEFQPSIQREVLFE